MKKILLASVALTAFAGAAAAEVSFSGDGAVGHVSDNGTAANNGMYWNADLNVAFSQELDNGITATAGMTFSFVDDNQGNTDGVDALSVDDNWKVTLSSDMASLSFGDVEFAAVSAWKSAGTMIRDGFREIGDDETVLKGNVSFGSVEASVSYLVTAGNDLQGADIGVTADLGAATVVVAYQEAIGTADEILGLSAATTLGGADLTVAYAKTGDEDSIGAKVGYAMGDVKVTAFYVAESAGDDGYGPWCTMGRAGGEPRRRVHTRRRDGRSARAGAADGGGCRIPRRLHHVLHVDDRDRGDGRAGPHQRGAAQRGGPADRGDRAGGSGVCPGRRAGGVLARGVEDQDEHRDRDRHAHDRGDRCGEELRHRRNGRQVSHGVSFA